MFFKDFTNRRKKTNRAAVFSCRHFPNIFKHRTTNETFQQSAKQDSFRHVLKSSAIMNESSGSQFFRTTTVIPSGPDAFDESRFIMTFLTILAVTEILCSFKLVIQWKAGKEISESSRLEFLEKISGNNFALSESQYNSSGLLNRGSIADLLFLRTLLAIRQKSRKPRFWEVIESYVLLAYASLAASRILLQRLLACVNFTLDSPDLFFWCKQKNWLQ